MATPNPKINPLAFKSLASIGRNAATQAGKSVVNKAVDYAGSLFKVGNYADKGIGDIPLQEGVRLADTKPRSGAPLSPIGRDRVERVSPEKSIATRLRDTVPRLATMDPSAAGTISMGMKIRMGLNKLGDKVKGVASAVRPEYLSNIANELTGPTGPRSPQLMGSTPAIPKVNMDATRAAISASESAIGRSADQSVDANTANAIRLGARAQTLTSLNTTAEQEARANVGIAQANQQASTQSRYVDTMSINKFQDDLQEFGNTRKSQKLANLSNFADKVVSRENLGRAEALDREKMGVMKSMFDDGVVTRAMEKAQKEIDKTKPKMRKGGKLKMYAI